MDTVNPELIIKAVQLGQVIRRHRAEGNLQSLVPPTMYGYQAFVRMATDPAAPQSAADRADHPARQRQRGGSHPDHRGLQRGVRHAGDR